MQAMSLYVADDVDTVGDVAVSLYDSVAIETVANGNNTFDMAFVPESVGPITANIFADTEIPESPYSIDVQPHLRVERITSQQPHTGTHRF